jgi:preprotein translocase subunit SecD
MMHISRWKALGILLTALLVSMLAVPNFFSDKTIQAWPKWAQHQVVLGLDLQGGSHLLFEVDVAAVRKEKLEQRSPITAIDAGFTRALATILDSNITTFIAAAVLFFIGTGPVRGFAVTLGIGIITTVFTAFTLTRLMVAWWVRWVRPQQLAIS